ncbi:penicillin-binding protein 2 [Clostridium sp. AM58-1XD]|uniref:peptidoglycan D,D-transpeptidase FtsI family protein n=1 Tax=Clostridium sp. AM58-1XD TaxID=2292307 RepID=UPI00325A5E43
MQEKLAITVLVITLALFALVMVLYNIVKNNKEEYNQIVLNQHSAYDSRTLPYRRGDIVDRNGTYLATSKKVYNLIIDARMISSGHDEEKNTNKYLDATTTALSTAFGYDRMELVELIQNNKDNPYIRYAKEITNEQKEAFEKLVEDTNKTNKEAKSDARIKGVWFEDEYKRFYPCEDLASSIVGFSSADGTVGTGGIEQSYNSTLMGTNGREYGYLNDESNLECVIKPAVNGNTIVSTIDVNVQRIVEKHISDWMNETGSDNIGVIVMNPNNGEVLAMASDRKFNLNDPRDLTVRYTQEEIDAMDEKAKSEAWFNIWRNFCVSDTFEPGSPSKIFTIASAMEEGVISGNESYLCDGVQSVGGHDIHCVNRYGHGPLTVEEGLMVSCNDVMMQIAAQEGKDRFYKYYDMFGFGQKTGIDLPGEADAKTLGYTAATADSASLATNAFGQNYNCTMIQMAAAYCSVLNGGSYYEPHVVKQILNENGSVVKKIDPVLVRETVSQPTSDFIKKALYDTVNAEKGTGKLAKVEGYEIGGKTGTAEKLPRGNRNYVVSFIGFAPLEKPEVLVYVAIDQPHVEDQPHSSYASAVFAKIMKDILPYLNVFPVTDTEDVPEEIKNQLPSEEGIISNEGESQEAGTGTEGETGEPTEPTEPTVPQTYPDEEFVPQDEGGSGIPAGVPGTENQTQGAPPQTSEAAEETTEGEGQR